MKSDDFRADKVFARGKNGGQGEGMLSTVGTEGVDGPGAAAESCFCELDPDVSCTIGGGGCNVDQNRTFVGLRELIRMISKKSEVQDLLPQR